MRSQDSQGLLIGILLCKILVRSPDSRAGLIGILLCKIQVTALRAGMSAGRERARGTLRGGNDALRPLSRGSLWGLITGRGKAAAAWLIAPAALRATRYLFLIHVHIQTQNSVSHIEPAVTSTTRATPNTGLASLATLNHKCIYRCVQTTFAELSPG